MKIKNLVFCGFMGSILAIGGAYADITTADASTLATAKYVKQGVASAISTAKDYTDGKVGTLTDLTTTAKTDVVAAINELKGALGTSTEGLAGKVTALETTVGKAAEGSNPATGLVKDVADNAAAIAAETSARTSADNDLAQRLDTLEGGEEMASSVANTVKTKIETLDAEVSQAKGADGLALSITEVDGKITAISGSIAANTYDAHGAAAAVQGSTSETVASVNTKVGQNTTAIETLNGTGDGSITKKISDALTNAGIADADSRLDAVESDVSGLKTAVGVNTVGSETGIYKDVADLKAADTGLGNRISAFETGGAHDVAALEATVANKQDALTAGNGITIGTDNKISATAATNGGVVVGEGGIDLAGTGLGVMYNGESGWTRLSITSSDFSM